MRYVRLLGIVMGIMWSGLHPAEPFQFTLADSSLPQNDRVIRLDTTGEWTYLDSEKIWKPLSLPFFFTDKTYLKVRCEFTLEDQDPEDPLLLASDGFGCSVLFYLNNKLIHSQSNDYVPFSIAVPNQYLKSEGRNELLLELLAPETTEQGYPFYARLNREPSYVGITRELKLLINPPDWVDGFTCKVAEITGSVILNYAYNLRFRFDTTESIRIEERFYDTQGILVYRRVFRFNPGTNPVTNQISLKPDHLWSTDTPRQLKAVILRLNNQNEAVDTESFRFGIRHLAVKGKKLLVNNREITLKGITYHENLLRFTSHNFYDMVKEDLNLLKSNGFNAIRFPHYMPHPYIISMADSIGFLLFGELPVWRYPVPLYKSDRLLENAKNTIANIIKRYRLSPSLTGLSLGQQIPLHEATVQKFMLILTRLAESNTDQLTYLSPIPGKALPSEASAEFYMYESSGTLSALSSLNPPFCAVGSVGILQKVPDSRRLKDLSSFQIQMLLKEEIETAISKLGLSGGFLNSFMDYHTALTSHSTLPADPYPVLPSGLYDLQRQAKFWSYDLIPTLWQIETANTLLTDLPRKRTNIFSILIFFATILFFSYYKQNARFRENLKRSLRHPYGFFVDMRERRIIPLLNSIIAGGYYSLVLAIFLASYLVYYNDSLYLQEIMSSLFAHTPLYEFFLKISASPYYSIEVMYGLFILYPLLLSLILKFLSLFSKHRIRFRQGLAIGFWSGAPFVFMAPLSLVVFHIMDNADYRCYLLYIFFLFILWAHFRIVNGIRVLFITKARKVFLILLLSYSIPFIIFWAILKPGPYWWEYLKLLLNSHALY